MQLPRTSLLFLTQHAKDLFAMSSFSIRNNTTSSADTAPNELSIRNIANAS